MLVKKNGGGDAMREDSSKGGPTNYSRPLRCSFTGFVGRRMFHSPCNKVKKIGCCGDSSQELPPPISPLRKLPSKTLEGGKRLSLFYSGPYTRPLKPPTHQRFRHLPRSNLFPTGRKRGFQRSDPFSPSPSDGAQETCNTVTGQCTLRMSHKTKTNLYFRKRNGCVLHSITRIIGRW